MSSDSSIYTLLGVVIGAILTFLSQHILYQQQEKSEIRKRAIDLKNTQCLILWNVLSDTYQYLYFEGNYSKDKMDLGEFRKHIKKLNVAIIQVELFISHERYLRLLEVRDALSNFIGKQEVVNTSLSYEEHMRLISELEKLMDTVRDILRKELQLAGLGVLRGHPKSQ